MLSLLPPQLPMLVGKKLKILRLERNYFVRPIEENRKKGQQALMDYLRSDRKTAFLDRLPLSAIQSTASSTTAKEATRTRSLLPSAAKSGRRSGKSPAQSRLDLILYLFCMFCLAALPISTTATFIVIKNSLQCTDLSLFYA